MLHCRARNASQPAQRFCARIFGGLDVSIIVWGERPSRGECGVQLEGRSARACLVECGELGPATFRILFDPLQVEISTWLAWNIGLHASEGLPSVEEMAGALFCPGRAPRSRGISPVFVRKPNNHRIVSDNYVTTGSSPRFAGNKEERRNRPGLLSSCCCGRPVLRATSQRWR